MNDTSAWQLRPVDPRYDRTTVALHWLTAILVATLWSMAQMEDLVARSGRQVLWTIHIVLGVVLAMVLIVRFAWRFSAGARLPAANSGALRTLSNAVHWALYGAVTLAVGLGIVNMAARGWNFGVFSIAAWAPGDKALHRSINRWHEIAAHVTVALGALHAAAGLTHHYLWRDGVLRRMSFAKARR